MVLSIISSICSVFGLFVCSVLDLHVTRRNCEFFDYFSEVYYDETDASSPSTPRDVDAAAPEDVALWSVAGAGAAGNRRVYGLDGEIEVRRGAKFSRLLENYFVT